MAERNTARRRMDNPAGPLFASGEYAEADITLESILAASGCNPPPPPLTEGGCGTACSASARCCAADLTWGNTP